ncbi:MAG: pyrroline-5-carboxylate reductase [Clostridia bacterium]|nr:pyrroline-5-carboxylate reductase [Clostridia bacterium]
MNKTIAFIGSGNMGGAIIGGIISAGLVEPQNIIAADPSDKARESLQEKYGIRVTTDNLEAVKDADIVFLAVKPHIYPIVIEQIAGTLSRETVVVTIAAGQTLANMAKMLGEGAKVVRTMPNTPALVGEGMAALCPNGNVTAEEFADVEAIFNSFGKCERITEDLFDAVVGVSGSSPAYVYMFIEAMADVAVAEGMPREKAYKFAAQAVLGSAKMVLETGRHPGDLKDMVCSPWGTTIRAVMELERTGMRGSVMSGMQACIDKSKAMSK